MPHSTVTRRSYQTYCCTILLWRAPVDSLRRRGSPPTRSRDRRTRSCTTSEHLFESVDSIIHRLSFSYLSSKLNCRSEIINRLVYNQHSRGGSHEELLWLNVARLETKVLWWRVRGKWIQLRGTKMGRSCRGDIRRQVQFYACTLCWFFYGFNNYNKRGSFFILVVFSKHWTSVVATL